MSNKEQTAVDWLFKQLWDEPQDKFTWYAILRQAKAMHKEEIKDAYYNGGSYEDLTKNEILKIAEQFYNETFNSDED